MTRALAGGFIIAAAWLAALTLPAAAQGSCFENLGRTGCPSRETFPEAHVKRLSCENLWLVRNSIFKARGYCFTTDVAIATFGNQGCVHQEQGQVPLNDHERTNVITIRRVEKDKGC